MLSQPRPAKPAPAASEPPLARLSLSALVGYSSAAGLAGGGGGSHMLDKLRRITLDRGESEAGGGAGDAGGLKARFRAKSFSTTGGDCCCCACGAWVKGRAYASTACSESNQVGTYHSTEVCAG
jgi:hypothetical protein